jgi:hypothetical protein
MSSHTDFAYIALLQKMKDILREDPASFAFPYVIDAEKSHATNLGFLLEKSLCEDCAEIIQDKEIVSFYPSSSSSQSDTCTICNAHIECFICTSWTLSRHEKITPDFPKHTVSEDVKNAYNSLTNAHTYKVQSPEAFKAAFELAHTYTERYQKS